VRNDLDMKSAILFISLGTWRVVSGEALQWIMCRAKMWRRCAARVALVAKSFDAQATVGVLSHQHTMCLCARSAKFSNTSHCSKSPTISKSKVEIVPYSLQN